MKILLIKQTSLGDLIHSTLCIEAIKEKWPEAEIHFMVDRACAFAVENNPHINRFFYFDQQNYRKRLKKSKLSVFSVTRDIRKTLKEIRQTHYDLAIDLQGIERSAFFLYFCRAKKKFTKGKKPFLKGFKNASKDDHALTELRGTIALAGVESEKHFPKIYLHQESAQTLEQKLPEQLKNAFAEKSEIIVISPYTSWETKDVPVKTWAAAAALIQIKYPKAQFVFSATPDKHETLEQELREIEKTNPDIRSSLINFAGKTNIQELLTLISKSSLVMASEGATGHMASALDRPLCVVFGPTKPSRVGPWGNKAKVIQSTEANCLGCYKRKCDNWICMKGIEAQIAEAAINLIQAHSIN
jgi:heptosyltransferase II